MTLTAFCEMRVRVIRSIIMFDVKLVFSYGQLPITRRFKGNLKKCTTIAVLLQNKVNIWTAVHHLF